MFPWLLIHNNLIVVILTIVFILTLQQKTPIGSGHHLRLTIQYTNKGQVMTSFVVFFHCPFCDLFHMLILWIPTWKVTSKHLGTHFLTLLSFNTHKSLWLMECFVICFQTRGFDICTPLIYSTSSLQLNYVLIL